MASTVSDRRCCALSSRR